VQIRLFTPPLGDIKILSLRTTTGHQSTTLTSLFYKNLYWKVIYVYPYESKFSRQIYLYDFHIFKLNDLKVIHDLYSQCLTQSLSKTTSNRETKGVVHKARNMTYEVCTMLKKRLRSIIEKYIDGVHERMNFQKLTLMELFLWTEIWSMGFHCWRC
jgi:hypothetical protein